MRVNLIIGWSTDTIHALHRYAYFLKDNFSSNAKARIVTCKTIGNGKFGGLGEELTNYFRYPFVVKKYKDSADINHITSQEFAYLGQMMPIKNMVIMVHDIFPITLDAKYTRFNYKFRIWQGIQAMKKSEAIVCNSEFTAKNIMEYGADKEKITVTGFGYDSKVYGKLNPSSLYQKYNLNKGKRYILHVGSENDRKNIPNLLKAFKIVKEKNPEVKLIRLGRPQHNANHQKNIELIKRLGLEQDITFVERVDKEDDLVKFYNLAEISVFPSFYEGFGVPIIESQACGCPVVTSTGPPMPEISQGAALLADPHSYKDIAAKMNRLLGDKALQKKLTAKGLKAVRKYTWKNVAKKTEEVYEKVLKK